jgi:hypothetical protein
MRVSLRKHELSILKVWTIREVLLALKKSLSRKENFPIAALDGTGVLYFTKSRIRAFSAKKGRNKNCTGMYLWYF